MVGGCNDKELENVYRKFQKNASKTAFPTYMFKYWDLSDRYMKVGGLRLGVVRDYYNE
jgi:hypothetical protein